MNDEKWTPSLSPNQEWKLHNGEGKVPEWFIRWSDRVYEAAKEEERKRIADSIGSFPLRDYMFFDESNWEAGYKALWEFKQSIINNHQ